MHRRQLVVGLACAVLAVAAPYAQTPVWPTKPVKIVIAYPPGGSTDIAGRLLAERLSKTTGQQFVVENRGGAGGTIGALSVVRAEPDGYTLLLAASPEVSIAPITMKAIAYDPVKDLMPISLVGVVPFFLVANPGFPPNTLAELVAYTQARIRARSTIPRTATTPRTISSASSSRRRSASIRAHVPYKGSGPSIIDLMGGQIQYTFDTPAATLGHVKSGKLKAIAVATPQRIANAPTVATHGESGTCRASSAAPGSVFSRRRRRRSADRRQDPCGRGRCPQLARAAQVVRGSRHHSGGNSADEFGRFIQTEVAKWRDLATKVGIKPE